MIQTSKIPEIIDPQSMYSTNGQEAWRGLGIFAEIAGATERLRGIRPGGSMFRSAPHRAAHPCYIKARSNPGLLSGPGVSVRSRGGPGLWSAANSGRD